MLTWDFEAKKGYRGSIIANLLREDLYDTLKLGNEQAFVLPGRYSFGFLTAKYNTSTSHAISNESQLDFGTFYDGWKFSFTTGPQIKIGTGLDIGITYNFDHVNFPDRDVKFTNHIAGLKGLLTVTTKTSLSAFVQYNTAINKVIANVRFRYNPREGNDFYIVYNEGLNTDIAREIPSLPYSEGRTILLKYTYTFRF
jgi:hypothetical protein